MILFVLVLASDGKNQPFNHVYDFLTFEHEVAIDQKVFEVSFNYFFSFDLQTFQIQYNI